MVPSDVHAKFGADKIKNVLGIGHPKRKLKIIAIHLLALTIYKMCIKAAMILKDNDIILSIFMPFPRVQSVCCWHLNPAHTPLRCEFKPITTGETRNMINWRFHKKCIRRLQHRGICNTHTALWNRSSAKSRQAQFGLHHFVKGRLW